MGTTYTEPTSQSGKPDGRHPSPPRPLYVGEKEKYVREMFAAIAPRYDLLNDLLSFRSHKRWRRLAVRMAQVAPGDHCLDVCTGTGDFAVDLAHAAGTTGQVIGADFCEPMIRNGLHKVASASGSPIRMMVANAEHLPYPSGRFDVATVGFAPGTAPAGGLRDPVGRRLAGPLRRGQPITDRAVVGPGLVE